MRGEDLVRVVTQKGQVTIPVEIRRRLGIEASDRVIFRVEDDKVYLTPVTETLESAFGAVEPLGRPEDFQTLRDQAMEDHVQRTMEEMGSAHDAVS
jgi:AbrB family looped-hinge helix DNA binding protein